MPQLPVYLQLSGKAGRTMRTYILTKALPVLATVLASLSYAQTNTENYVQSKTCLNEDCTKISEAITYFDGLGRPKQVVSVKSTPSGKDLVTPVTYDGFGRKVKDILPVPADTQNSMIHTGIVNESAANTYYGVSNAYLEKRWRTPHWIGSCSRLRRESPGR